MQSHAVSKTTASSQHTDRLHVHRLSSVKEGWGAWLSRSISKTKGNFTQCNASVFNALYATVYSESSLQA